MSAPIFDFRGNKAVNEDGTFSDVAQNYFDALSKYIYTNLGGEGIVMPSQNTVNIGVIANNQNTQSAYTCQFGTFVYNSDINDPQVSINVAGVPTFVSLLTPGGVTISGVANQIVVTGPSPNFTVGLASTIITNSGTVLDDGSGNMSIHGTLTLSANPTLPLQAATKQYVDSAISGDVTSITGTPNQILASSATGAVTLSFPSVLLSAFNILDNGSGLATFLNIIDSGLTASQAVVTNGSKQLISLAYTSANTASTLVLRDILGNFSAGTITAAITGHSSLDLAIANNLSDVSSASISRTNLGLEIGTNVEAWSSVLDTVTAGTYVGSTSITTLGTITTGAWHGSLVTGTFGGTGVNNGSSTITIAGSHTLSGAFTSTFVFTANTNVTFPTSGTLATVGGTISSILGTTNEISAVTVSGVTTLSFPSVLHSANNVVLDDGSSRLSTTYSSTSPFFTSTQTVNGNANGILFKNPNAGAGLQGYIGLDGIGGVGLSTNTMMIASDPGGTIGIILTAFGSHSYNLYLQPNGVIFTGGGSTLDTGNGSIIAGGSISAVDTTGYYWYNFSSSANVYQALSSNSGGLTFKDLANTLTTLTIGTNGSLTALNNILDDAAHGCTFGSSGTAQMVFGNGVSPSTFDMRGTFVFGQGDPASGGSFNVASSSSITANKAINIGNNTAHPSNTTILGAVIINNGGSNSVGIGTGSFSGILGLGNASATTNMLGVLNIGTSGSAAINIGTGTFTGSVVIGGNSITINANSTGGIAIGNALNTVSIGSQASASSIVNIQPGTGNNQTNICATSGYSGTLTLGNSSATFDVNFTSTKYVSSHTLGLQSSGTFNVGDTTNTTIQNIQTTTSGTINVGTNLVGGTLNLGHINTNAVGGVGGVVNLEGGLVFGFPTAYSTGTASTSGASNTVTGSGTSWNVNMVGGIIMVTSGADIGAQVGITAVGSTTSLTTDAPINIASGSSYIIYFLSHQISSRSISLCSSGNQTSFTVGTNTYSGPITLGNSIDNGGIISLLTNSSGKVVTTNNTLDGGSGTASFAGMITASGGITGTLTGHASLDLALTGGTVSGALTLSSTASATTVSAGSLIFSGSSLSIGRAGTPISGNPTELNFGTSFGQRMICLYDGGSSGAQDQNQFYGFGITSGTLHYSVVATTAAHKFYAGVNSSTSNLLFTIAGNGVITTGGGSTLDNGSGAPTFSGLVTGSSGFSGTALTINGSAATFTTSLNSTHQISNTSSSLSYPNAVATITGPDVSNAPTLTITRSGTSASKRTMILMQPSGSNGFEINTDTATNGTLDFGIYSEANTKYGFKIDAFGQFISGCAPLFTMTVTRPSAGNQTITAAQILGGIVQTPVESGAFTWTLDTGTNIYTALGSPAVGTTLKCLFSNSNNSAFTMTIAGNTGTTLSLCVNTISNNNSKILFFVVTGTNTVTVYD